MCTSRSVGTGHTRITGTACACIRTSKQRFSLSFIFYLPKVITLSSVLYRCDRLEYDCPTSTSSYCSIRLRRAGRPLWPPYPFTPTSALCKFYTPSSLAAFKFYAWASAAYTWNIHCPVFQSASLVGSVCNGCLPLEVANAQFLTPLRSSMKSFIYVVNLCTDRTTCTVSDFLQTPQPHARRTKVLLVCTEPEYLLTCRTERVCAGRGRSASSCFPRPLRTTENKLP